MLLILALILLFAMVQLVVLSDVYTYNKMFSSIVQMSYIELYYKLAYLTGIIYIVCFTCIVFKKHIKAGLLLGTATFIFTTQLKYGTVLSTLSQQDDFDVVLYTVPNNTIRRELFNEHYKTIRQMPLVDIYYGVPKSNLTFLKTERNKGSYALYTGFKNATRNKFNLRNPKKWVLMFEDDAVTVPWFRDRLSTALYWYDEYDIIWLDTTNSLGWVTLRKLYNSLTGIVFYTNSLNKISSLLEFNNPNYVKHIKNWNNDNPPYYLDIVLAEYCNLGVLKCAHTPIVHPNGLKTTIG